MNRTSGGLTDGWLGVWISVMLFVLPGTSSGVEVRLPGPWYDQDKTLSGGIWDWNYWRDDNDDWVYQPNEPWTDTLDLDPDHDYDPDPGGSSRGGTYYRYGPGGEILEIWKAYYDASCWAAAAANLVRYVDGADRYMDWVYDRDWPDGSSWTWQDGGGTVKALDAEGYDTVSIRNSGGQWPAATDPLTWIESQLADGLPVSLGVTWSTTDPGKVSHLITCYGIDRAAQTIILSCSDSDVGGTDQHTFSYTFNTAREVNILGYFGSPLLNNARTFATNEWVGSGTGGDDSTTGATTWWDRDANWQDGIPAEMDFPRIEFTNPGKLLITSDAVGTSCTVKGDPTTISVAPIGSMDFQSLHNLGGHINVRGAVLVDHMLFNDGTIDILDGMVYGRSTYIGAQGPGVVTLAGGSLSARDLYLSQAPGAAGELHVSGGTVSVERNLIAGPASTIVFDPGSGWLNVGNDLRLEAGSLTATDTDLFITDLLATAADGDAEVSFQGGTIRLGGLVLGERQGDEGTLTLDSHAGEEPQLLTAGSPAVLCVGYHGIGRVEHLAGTVAREFPAAAHPDLTLGFYSDARGHYQFDAGSIAVGDLTVGRQGAGEFVQNSGWVTVHGDFELGAFASGDGQYDLNGGTLQIDGRVRRGDGTGTLAIDGGHLFLNPMLVDWSIDRLRIGNAVGSEGHFEVSQLKSMTVGELRVGNRGQGTFDTQGWTTVEDTLYVGAGAGSEGQVNQTRGKTTVTGDLHLGYGAASTGRYLLAGPTPLAPATLQVDGTLNVGYAGSGFLELGGNAEIEGAGEIQVTAGRGVLGGGGNIHLPVVNDNLLLMPPFQHLYLYDTLQGSGDIVIGDGALVAVQASGIIHGTVANDGTLAVGGQLELRGSLSGGDLTVATPEATLDAFTDIVVDSVDVAGKLTTDSMIMTRSLRISGELITRSDVTADRTRIDGGTTVHTSGHRSLGNLTLYEGSYDLESAGQLQTGAARVYSSFHQVGGQHNSMTLQVGGDPDLFGYGGRGSYQISGGRLDVESLLVGHDLDGDGRTDSGQFALADREAHVTVSKQLVIGQGAELTVDRGAEIHMTGSTFDNHSEAPARCSDLSHLSLVFEGGDDTRDTFELAGRDWRADPAGLVDNFAIGELQLGGTAGIGQVQLVDLFDNQPDWVGAEALYVHQLILGAGSILDINGFSVYYESFIDLGGKIILDGGSLMEIVADILRGDVNGDGIVNGLDVDPFVDVLLNGPYLAAADMNDDGFVNGLDSDPFVAAVVGGTLTVVPEPSSCALFILGLLACGSWRRKPQS